MVIVGFFKDTESDMAKAYVAAASAIDEYKVLITSKDIISDLKDGSIIMYKDFDEPKIEYSGDADDKVIKKSSWNLSL